MKRITLGFAGSIISFVLFSQNALVLNGAYVIMSGGTSAAPTYVVINENSTSGIIRPGGGHIHSENQYNYVEWLREPIPVLM